MSCDASNCTNVDSVALHGPNSGLMQYNFGHIVVPWSSFTVRSMVPGVMVNSNVNSDFYNNNIRSAPACGVMTLYGQGVSITDMHFVYSDECVDDSVVENSQRVAITMKQTTTGTSSFNNLTCDNCFTPVALIPHGAETIDTTNTNIDNVYTTHDPIWPPISFLCGACVGGLSVENIPSNQSAWWTSSMVPTGTIKLFNTTASFAGSSGIACTASQSIPECSISQTSLSVTTIVMIVLILMIVIHLLWSIFEMFKKKAHTMKND